MLIKIGEAGKTFSGANERTIAGVIKTLVKMLRTFGATVSIEDDDSEEIDAEEAKLLSFADIASRLDTAIKGTTAADYCYVRDVFPTFVVYSTGYRNGLTAMDYSIDDNGAITLSNPRTVTARTVYEDMMGNALVSEEITTTESEFVTEIVSLTEAATNADGVKRIKLIAPGKGSSGFYPAEVLKRDGPAVFRRGTQMFLDHATPTQEKEQPEGSITRLAAVLETDAVYENDPIEGEGLFANARIVQHGDMLKALAKDIGVSIRAMGTARVENVEGYGKIPVVEKITSAKSVDFVTRAGAGGKIVSLFEAARDFAVANTGETEMSEKEIAELRETIAKQNAALNTLRERSARESGRIYVANAIPRSLPQVARDRIVASVAIPLTEAFEVDTAALDTLVETAVAQENAYLASLGVGRIVGMGSTSTATDAPTLETSQKQLSEAISGDWG